MMDEQELEKQFEATDYDENGNIVQTPPPPAAAKKKRVTMADLKKDLSDLESYIENEILAWCDQLGVRTDTLEQTTATHNKALLEDVKPRLDALERVSTKILPEFIDDMIAKCDNQDAAIGALADALRQHFEVVATAPPEPKPELLLAQPPMIPEQITTTKGDIEAVASVCQTMADVLMICRALKAVEDLPDDDRTYLLTTACRAAGVPLSPGLQIRAGAASGRV